MTISGEQTGRGRRKIGGADTTDRLGAAAWRNAFDVQVVLDEHGSLLQANEAVRAVLGHDPDALRGLNVLDLVHPEDRDRAAAELTDFLRHPEARYAIHFRALHRDGSAVPLECAPRDFVFEGRRTVVITARDLRERALGDAIRAAEQRIARAAPAATSVEALGGEIHEALAAVMPAHHFYIALYSREHDALYFPCWVDRADPAPPCKRPGRGLTEYALNGHETVLLDEAGLAALEASGAAEVLGARPRQWLGGPLRYGNAALGVVAVQTYADDPPLTERHRKILHNLLPAITTAIHAKLQERMNADFAQGTRRRDALLAATATAAERFMRDEGWTRHIDPFLRELGLAAEVSRVALFQQVDAGGGAQESTLRCEWNAPTHAPLAEPGRPFSCNLSLAGLDDWCARLANGETAGGVVAELPEPARGMLAARGILSVHLAPIVTDRAWWGFICFAEGRVARRWTAAEKEILRLAAQLIAQAIRREGAEEETRLQRTALGAAANSIVITNAQGRILWVNDAFCRHTGYARHEVVGQTPSLLASGVHARAFYDTMWKTITAGLVWRGEITNRRKNGSLVTEEMTITPVRDSAGKLTHFIAIKQDITEQKTLELQLRQAQKMESIGRMAGGIAHDFNNLLQAITGFSAILLSEIAEGDPRRSDVTEIDRAAQRAAALTRQLLAFGRRQKMHVESLALNEIVRGAAKLLHRLLGENIRIETNFDEQLPPIRADAGQLEQILVNLSINARDAMPGGGLLRFATSVVCLEDGALPPVPGARPGRFVRLCVQDTGVGMTPEVREQLFEPFFTTKEPGRGTGLGLPVVYGIVRQHEGFIEVHSAPGEGSAFCIYLPTEETGALPASPAPAATTAARMLEGRGEHILVVEDETGVRELTTRILHRNHYRVTAVGTVAEARALLLAPEIPFALMFSDVVLPDGNGLDLAEEARARHPALKILLTSGYTQERERWRERLAALDGFLAKPYPPPALLHLMGQTLHPSHPQAS
jgi:PAS domain S-box-containing protein